MNKISEDYCEDSYYREPNLDIKEQIRQIRHQEWDVVEYDLGEISSLPGEQH